MKSAVFLTFGLFVSSVGGLLNIETNVIVDSNAEENLAPYMVSFQKLAYSGSGYEAFCGGSIINKNWILTAAHCFPNSKLIEGIIIFAGCVNIENPERDCQKRKISKYNNHKLYVGEGGISPYDISLVKVNQPYTFSVNINFIALPDANSIPYGEGRVFGWGSISNTEIPIFPDLLQTSVLPIIEMETCELAIGKPYSNYVHRTNFCTGPLTGDKGICNSDSGGPFIQKFNNKDVLIGIVSWGKTPCGQKNAPSVFVKISDFLKWIGENQN